MIGPQTSVIAFNQSAFYFYILYPLFVLTNHSLFSSIYTLVLFYLSILIAGFFLLRKNSFLLKSFFVLGFLIAIHPQFIIQNRYVWNPSFVGPLLAVAFFSFSLLQKKFSLFKLLIFSSSIALAVSISYTIAPVLIGFLILIFLKERKNLLKHFLGLTGFLFFFNLPTFFFELRHHFPLTKLLISRPSLDQIQTELGEKLTKLFTLSIGPKTITNVAIFLLILTIILIDLFYQKRHSKIKKEGLFLKNALLLFLTATAIVVFIPFTLHSHFVFGPLVTAMIIISLLSYRALIPVLFLFGSIWLQPKQVFSYFRTAPRTAIETIKCAQEICRQEKEPMFISVQSGYYPYHNGPEFKFLFLDQGCQILDLEKTPDQAQKMAVVADNSKYEHQKTQYHELELFGKSKEVQIYSCLNNLQVHILEKI